MKILRVCPLLTWCALSSGPAAAADLSTIDRTIAKQPVYNSKPKYCLLVFGPEAKTRVWVVQDGDALYVDRNRNGNLTDDGGPFRAKSRDWKIDALLEADGKTRHTDLRIIDRNTGVFMCMEIAGGLHAEVGNEIGELQLSDHPREAPIVHFAGPLTVLMRSRGTDDRAWVPGSNAHFIVLIGTPGLGEGASAYYHHDQFGNLNIAGEVEFAHKTPGPPPLKVRIGPCPVNY